jgi:hypothetical protein
MKKFLILLSQRWKADTPQFFQRIMSVGLSISAVAVAMHFAAIGAGASEPEWWSVIYPYVVGIPAGMAVVAKLTKEEKEDKNESK